MAYAKLIAAVIGLLVIAVKQFTGFTVGDDVANKIVDLILYMGTAFGVFKVENK